MRFFREINSFGWYIDTSRKFINHNQNFNKEGHRAMNRDEGSYQLSQAYDRLLDATADRRIKTRKN